MIEIIKPYGENPNIDLLLDEGSIIKTDSNNFYIYASIFPKSKIKEGVDFLYKKDRIITTIDDEIFTDKNFKLLDKEESTVIENNKRSYIKAKSFGNYEDSVKRYTNLNKPIDINKNIQEFLNLPRPQNRPDKTDVTLKDLTFETNNIDEFFPKVKPDLFADNINHPHIQQSKLRKKPFKYNNKNIILEVLKWAKEKGITYIYCINEHRPYIQNKSYVTPYIYYSVKGF